MKLIRITQTFLVVYFVLTTCTTTLAQKNAVANAIDELLTPAYPENDPGAAVLVARDNKIIFQNAYGKASLKTSEMITPRYVFRIGSVTKQFTAVAILKLATQGKIKLDDPVIKFIPEFSNGRSITLRHLLTHTSGIPSYTGLAGQQGPEQEAAEQTIQERFNVFKDLPLEFAPGARYEYSNSGYFILGMIIEKVSGMSYGDYLKKEFFLPLGMTSTYYDGGSQTISPRSTGYVQREKKFIEAGFVHHSKPYAAGALASSTEDLLKWNNALFSFEVLPRNVIEEAWKPARLNDGREINYGFGWSLGRLDDLQLIYHGGAIKGYVCYVLFIPHEKLFVAILTNKDQYGVIDQSEKIARIVLNRPVTNPPQISVQDNILEEYTGMYKNSHNQYRAVTLENNKLFTNDVYGDIVEILPYRKDGFFMKDKAVRLDFERDGNEVFALKITASDWIIDKEIKTDSLLAPSRKSVRLPDVVFGQYIGMYEIANGFNIKIWRDNDRCMVTSSLHGDFEILAESETRFFIPGVGASLEFVKDDGKGIPSLILTVNGDVKKGLRVD